MRPEPRPFSWLCAHRPKRLAEVFVSRRDEPWLIALVASSLDPGKMRELMDALPHDLQVRVAVAAVTAVDTPRPISRRRIAAIDTELRNCLEAG